MVKKWLLLVFTMSYLAVYSTIVLHTAESRTGANSLLLLLKRLCLTVENLKSIGLFKSNS